MRSKPIWDTAAQGEPGWIKARQGKLTASRMAEAIPKRGDNVARFKLQAAIVAEQSEGYSVDHYVSDAMRWGSFWEATARETYMLKTGEYVQQCGFAEHSEIRDFGASPDGLVAPDGLIEIKCPTYPKFVQWKLEDKIPKEYKPQMLAQMAVTGRNWCDFVAFYPSVDDAAKLSEEDKPIFGKTKLRDDLKIKIWRFAPTLEEIEAIEDVARTFIAEVDVLFDKFTLGGD